MPSHCMHDCACACGSKIKYVLETEKERKERLNKIEEGKKRQKIIEKEKLKKEIERLENEINKIKGKLNDSR